MRAHEHEGSNDQDVELIFGKGELELNALEETLGVVSMEDQVSDNLMQEVSAFM